MLNFIFTLGFLAQKNIHLADNSVHKLVGNGPPIILSSGLYGTMPDFMYSDMINSLKTKYTIILPNSKPITHMTVEEICTSLKVETVGFLSHSSLDPYILESKCLQKAVCIDPVSLPSISFPQIHSFNIESASDTLVIKTKQSQEADIPFIPTGFELFITNAFEITYEDIGHADVLDDFWAQIADNIGIRGLKEEDDKQSFEEWKLKQPRKNRKKYRDMILNDIVQFFDNSIR